MRLVMLALVIFATFGCHFEIAGMDDVELDYDAIDRSSPNAAHLVDRIRARLGSAQIVGDVTTSELGPARVIVDAAQERTAEALLRWPGGVSFFRVADVRGDAIDPHAVPLFSIANIASVETSTHGSSVRILFDSGATAPTSVNEMLAVACDRALLGTTDHLDLTKPLEFSLGSNPQAYARAALIKRLLATPPLPPLREVSAHPLPPNHRVAALGLLLPLVISLSWLAFVRRFDRAHPEPLWLVLVTFALGGAGVLVAAFVEGALANASPYLNPTLMSFGGQSWALPIAICAFAITIGVVEEGVKLLAVVIFARRRAEFDEPVDGIIYGTAAALGFAAIENVNYFALGRMSSAVIAMRTLTSAPAHLFFGSIWGFALGASLISRRRRLPFFFAAAALAHGAFDALLSSEHAAPLVLPLELALATTFVLLLRGSLRHGAVREDTIPASAIERLRLPLGSRAAFFAFVVLMHVAAVGVAFVGIVFEASKQRADLPIFAAAIAMLACFGISAAGVTATLPLDLVVDDQGVTFGGTARRWNEMESVQRRGKKLVVHCKRAGDLTLGPAKSGALDMAEAAIAERLATRG